MFTRIIALTVLVAPALCGQRQMEKLGRGVIAMRAAESQVYVGWRLLGTDPATIAFNLYRATAAKRP